MIPSLLTGAIICPIRIIYIALFAAMVATVSPFTAGSSLIGGEAFSRMYFDEILVSQNLSTAEGIIAPDSVLATPEGRYIGQQGVLDFLATLESSFTNVQFVPERYLVADDVVTVRYTLTGFHTGPYLGLSPTCADVAVNGVAILNFNGTGLTDQWISYDRQSLVAQIAAMDGLDQHTRPRCDMTIGLQPDLAPALAPPPGPTPVTTPAHDATCIRRDHCEAPS